MAAFVDLLTWVCFLTGGFLSITGGVGLLRLPDFFSRVHAVSLTDTLAAPLILFGLILQLGWSLGSAKVLLIMVFLLVTSPTASLALAKAALHGSLRPMIGAAARTGERPSKT